MDWSPVKRFAILTTIAAATVALAACGSASGPRSDRTAAPSAEGGGTPATPEAIVPSGATDAAVRRFVSAGDGAVEGGAGSGNADICGSAVIVRTS